MRILVSMIMLALAACRDEGCPPAESMPIWASGAFGETHARLELALASELVAEPPLWIEDGSVTYSPGVGLCLESDRARGAKFIASCNIVVVQRDRPEWAARHEFVHQVLYANGRRHGHCDPDFLNPCDDLPDPGC